MTKVAAHKIRKGDIINGRHGHAEVIEQFRDIITVKGQYELGDVMLKVKYDNGRENQRSMKADFEITRVSEAQLCVNA